MKLTKKISMILFIGALATSCILEPRSKSRLRASDTDRGIIKGQLLSCGDDTLNHPIDYNNPGNTSCQIAIYDFLSSYKYFNNIDSSNSAYNDMTNYLNQAMVITHSMGGSCPLSSGKVVTTQCLQEIMNYL